MATTQGEIGESRAIVGGEAVAAGEAVEVRSPLGGDVVAVVHRAGPVEVGRAIAGAVGAHLRRDRPRYAIQEMSELKLLALTRGPLT